MKRDTEEEIEENIVENGPSIYNKTKCTVITCTWFGDHVSLKF